MLQKGTWFTIPAVFSTGACPEAGNIHLINEQEQAAEKCAA